MQSSGIIVAQCAKSTGLGLGFSQGKAATEEETEK
jgi:hypothetical protein